MTRFSSFALCALLLCAGACSKPKPKEVSSLARKQAAALVSDADFAIQIHDDARAEASLSQAVELDPEQTDVWLELGYARKRLGNADGARTAYKGALAAAKRKCNEDPKDFDSLIDQVFSLALLGQLDDARALLADSAKAHPDNRQLQGFVTDKVLDRMIADPQFKKNAL